MFSKVWILWLVNYLVLIDVEMMERHFTVESENLTSYFVRTKLTYGSKEMHKLKEWIFRLEISKVISLQYKWVLGRYLVYQANSGTNPSSESFTLVIL
jgi:hypothetical protein